MKTRAPYDRDDLRTQKSDRVLEVGCGHNFSYRANGISET